MFCFNKLERPGVGKELYSKDATFRAAMDRCVTWRWKTKDTAPFERQRHTRTGWVSNDW